MTSFVRRTTVATLAFGVVAGSFALAGPTFADEPTETPAATATPTESPSPATPTPTGEPSPSESPAAPETPQAPSVTSSKTEYLVTEQLDYSLSGFAPNTAIKVTVTDQSGQTVEVNTEDTPTTDEQGRLEGLLGVENGTPDPGQYTFTFTQEGGASATLQVTYVAENAQPAPSDPAVTAPSAAATKPVFTPDEEITYTISGFTPNAVVQAEATLPDGSTLQAETDGNKTNENGEYAGRLQYTQSWPLGSYTVRVYLEDGTEATFTFEVTQDGQPSGNDNRGGTDAGAPQAPDRTGDQLAVTGGEAPFGPAGLGLLLAASGTAAFVGHRIVARRRAM